MTHRRLPNLLARFQFESSEEWTVAVAEEIQSGLLPGTPGFAALDQERLHPFSEAARADTIKMHSSSPLFI
jgi:hypothetical protein